MADIYNKLRSSALTTAIQSSPELSSLIEKITGITTKVEALGTSLQLASGTVTDHVMMIQSDISGAVTSAINSAREQAMSVATGAATAAANNRVTGLVETNMEGGRRCTRCKKYKINRKRSHTKRNKF